MLRATSIVFINTLSSYQLTGLISAGVEAEVKHHSATVLRGHNVGTTVRVGHVVSEELRLELLEDVDAVSLELEGINGLRDGGVLETAGRLHRRERLVLGRGSVERHGIVNHDVTGSASGLMNRLVCEQSQTMPVAVLVHVRGILVKDRTKANVHGLNGPLELGEELVLGGNGQLSHLLAMHTDEREADTLNVFCTKVNPNELIFTITRDICLYL